MSNLPISFSKTDIVTNPSLHLSYTFDTIISVEPVKSQLPISQDYLIQALKINLEGRTSNPNISLSIDSITTLFTLNTCYITNKYPRAKVTTTSNAFVIEGYSIEHVNKERLLIFLPMTQNNTNTTNIFHPLGKAIISKSKIEQALDLNEFIPSTSDGFIYYKYNDNAGVIFHVIYFESSELEYISALTDSIPGNSTQYTSTEKIVNYKSTTSPKHHTNMTNQFEDNIYIDCVPVDMLEQQEKKYLHIDSKYATNFNDFLTYIAYFIILTLIVYGIYYIYIYATGVKSSPSPK